ncbi:hypothetical protein ABDK00_001230 [Niabella insulamsoli]|uniref:hypothetical protein n=1 Tax=Niabella insulamsoli TaxID=3144874 RepID=UPI0031FD9F75
MAKFPTFPTLYGDLKTIEISFLKQHGYLQPEQIKAGTIAWSRNGENTGRISIKVCTRVSGRYIEFDYSWNDKPVNYRVPLILKPSNLGKGSVWFFCCPHTGKLCRKLFLANTYFYHRLAFTNCMYASQTQSKKYRQLEKHFSPYYDGDRILKELNKPYFKNFYAGKPTKRYLKLTKKMQVIERLPAGGLEKLFLS